MVKKRLVILSGTMLVALLVGLVGVTTVLAQEPTPEPEMVAPWRGFGMRDSHGGFFGGDGRWTMFDTAAEALGLTPEELFAEMHAGKTLEEIAEAQGVEMEMLQEAMNAARSDAMQAAIEQAIEDGTITQEQADWLLEGLDRGFLPSGRGFGHGRRWGGCPGANTSTDGEDA